MTAQVINIETILSESREVLNREFLRIKKTADIRNCRTDRASAEDFRRFVIEFMTPARIKKANLRTSLSIKCFAIQAAGYAEKQAFIATDRAFAKTQQNLYLRQMGCM